MTTARAASEMHAFAMMDESAAVYKYTKALRLPALGPFSTKKCDRKQGQLLFFWKVGPRFGRISQVWNSSEPHWGKRRIAITTFCAAHRTSPQSLGSRRAWLSCSFPLDLAHGDGGLLCWSHPRTKGLWLAPLPSLQSLIGP